MKWLPKQGSAFQESFGIIQSAEEMERRLEKFCWRWIKSSEDRERMNGKTSLSGHHSRRLWGAWERFGVLGLDREKTRGTEKEGKGGGEESMDSFGFLVFKCCLEGNKGTILQCSLVSRALDPCNTALKTLNEWLSVTLNSVSELLKCPAWEMPEEVTRQTVLCSQACGHWDKGWVSPWACFCRGDGVLATAQVRGGLLWLPSAV